MLSPEKLLTGRYDKRHLVPFGEYIPLKINLSFSLINWWLALAISSQDKAQWTLSLPNSTEKVQASLAVPICFEVIFPNLVRHMAKEGANFLVTLTNDAWFGNSSAPYQHFSMVVFRAVEKPFGRRSCGQHRRFWLHQSRWTHSDQDPNFHPTSHDRFHSTSNLITHFLYAVWGCL